MTFLNQTLQTRGTRRRQDVELNDGVTAYKSKRVDSGVQVDFLTRVDGILFHSLFQFNRKADNEQQRDDRTNLQQLHKTH